MGTFSAVWSDFPGCVAFIPQPPPLLHIFIFFLKRELSPLHNTSTRWALATASGSQETGAGWSLHPPINLSSTPLASLPVRSFFYILLPLRWCPAACRLLLSRDFADTPSETSDLISRQEVKGLGSSCESNPTHLYAFDWKEGSLLRGRGGVESPRVRVSQVIVVHTGTGDPDPGVTTSPVSNTNHSTGTMWRKRWG